MQRYILFTTIFVLLTLHPAAQTGTHKPLMGFTADHAAKEMGAESTFDGILQRDSIRQRMKRLSARPHHVGSPYDRENAEFIASQFRSWGFDANVEEFWVLFPTPKTRLVEMVSPSPFTAKLAEPALSADATSGQQTEQLPTYNAYSADGDVTGELVYANYGVPKDYETLDRLGIDVRGKIVITRYGGSWRGIKPKVAAEHGAVGCLIYSDPKEDGYYDGDVYPKGPYRNESGVQRGSVADMPLYTGDPLTPFIGATKNAKRLSLKDTKVLTKIPVLPLSYGDAAPLLGAMGGPVAPEEWRGALPITYHVGPGPAKVHLKVASNWDIVPIYDAIGKIPGVAHPDEWIIRGNHHDGWVNGAEDPISGQASMMEEARGIGVLLHSGWRPARTIIYCAWDGEEPALLGSTEWAEAHADALGRKAVVYINSDSNNRGFFFAGGSHTLEKFVNQVARDVMDPEKHVTVGERARAFSISQGSGDEAKEARERPDIRLFALGSGSDYTPFLQHLGISSLAAGYGGEDGGGSYHSIYDSYAYYTRFMDTSFEYGVTMAETGGRIVLRLADADILPFEFSDFAETVGKYVKEVIKLTDDMRVQTDEDNQKIQDRADFLAADPREPFVEPKKKERVPFINFAPLQNAVAALTTSSKNYAKAMSDLDDSTIAASGKQIGELNGVLMNVERSLTRKEGLPGRPWYVHEIYAPGIYTGYGVKTLPAIRESIELRNWKQAEEQVDVVAGVILNFSHTVDKATSILTAITSSGH